MDKLILLRRSQTILNSIIFVILSSFFLYTIHAKSLDIPFYSIKGLTIIYGLGGLTILFMLATVYWMIFLRRNSSKLILAYLSSTWLYCFYVLYQANLDKTLLLFVFLYILLSFYFYLLWDDEISLACYNPNFSFYDIDQSVLLSINLSIVPLKGKSVVVKLRNWDERSVFVETDKKISGPVSIELKFEERIFKAKGIVITQYDGYHGVGIRLLNKATNQFSWPMLFDILHSRGFLPSWVKN